MKRILFFFGGCSSEYDVSLQSAAAVLTHLRPGACTPIPVGITRRGDWRYFSGPVSAIADGSWEAGPSIPCTLTMERGRSRLLLLDGSGETRSFDAAFPLLHGQNGEDGTLQGLLELMDIPILGCGCLASTLCMDKHRAHLLAAAAGVSVPRGIVLDEQAGAEAIRAAAAQVGYPLFVKPVRAGSSFGVTPLAGPAGLEAAVALARRYDREVLVEEAVDGIEVGCAVLGTHSLTLGAVDEIQLAGSFFDYHEKYTLETASIRCPARLDAAVEAAVRRTAEAVYRALDCRGFARVDLFVTAAGTVKFHEVNTIPGFTAHSRYPQMMARAGLPFDKLLDAILDGEEGQ